jgi:AraC-like DNA-binding protein
MNYTHLILIIVATLSLVKFSVLIYKKSGDRTANLLLASFFFIIFLYTTQDFVIETGLLQYVSWFYAWPLPIYALTQVALFFYFIKVIEKKMFWKPWYFILFIPFVLGFIDVIFFYAKPVAERWAILNDAMLYPENRFEKLYGLFTLKFHFLIKYIWFLGTCIFLWFKLIPFLSKSKNEPDHKNLNRWLISFLGILTIVVSVILLLIVSHIFPAIFGFLHSYFNLFTIIMFSVALLLAIVPLYFPTIFYSLPVVTTTNVKQKKAVNLSDVEDQAHHKYGLEVTHLKEKLLEKEIQQLFIDPNFDLNALANHLKLPSHHLSHLFNQHIGLSFANYRNQLKMEYAAKLIEDGFLVNGTTEGLALECGFISRSAFSKTFKTFKGLSPSDYSAKFQASVISP